MNEQSAITEPTSETLQQAIRNYVAGAENGRTLKAILLHLADSASACYLSNCAWALEESGEITRTRSGAYILGNPPTQSATDLTLTSNDPAFGQPSLF